MPSSTSSSEPPVGRWGRTWLVAVGVTLALLILWEGGWRLHGFVPSVRDDPQTWVATRARVRGDSVVLVGSSRIQSAIHPETFAAALDGRVPIHLGLPAGSPLPILQELAADEDFAGVVLVDLIPRLVFNARRVGVPQTRPYLEAYRAAQRSPAKWIEAQLRLVVNGALAHRGVTAKAPSIAEDLLARRAPEAPVYVTRPDRFRALEFPQRRNPGRALVWARAFRRDFRPAAPPPLRRRVLQRLAEAIERIQARGGRVILLRLPVSGDCLAAEQELYPRADYWDPLVAASSAVAIHFADHPELAHFECGDCSHLDHRDAPAFTRALVAVLRAELTAAGR